MEKKTQPQYNQQMRSKASVSAVLRSIVAFYLAYLGWTIARGAGGEDTTMQPWVGWLICGVFCAVGIAFGVYTLRRYQADLKAAELPGGENSDGSGSESGEDTPGEEKEQ